MWEEHWGGLKEKALQEAKGGATSGDPVVNTRV